MKRLGVNYHRWDSKNFNSAYLELRGLKYPYRVRISDHAETTRDIMKSSDFMIYGFKDIGVVQKAIEHKLRNKS